jgi:hypothetical protein
VIIKACITFFFNPSRLNFLEANIKALYKLKANTKVNIITNSDKADELKAIKKLAASEQELIIHTPKLLGHPYFLPWSHLDIFREDLERSPSDYYLYLEDDLLFSQENLEYFIKYKKILQPYGFYPSFLRYEVKNNQKYSTDLARPKWFFKTKKIYINDEVFLNVYNPYQGMYLLDQEMMQEYFSHKITPDFGSWGIREKAAQGLTYLNVPKGFHSRNLVKYDVAVRSFPAECLIHHMPNNYVEGLAGIGITQSIDQIIKHLPGF